MHPSLAAQNWFFAAVAFALIVLLVCLKRAGVFTWHSSKQIHRELGRRRKK